MGDADRFGIMDSDGTFITPNQVIFVLLYYLNKINRMAQVLWSKLDDISYR
jgi:phosphoglucomutase